MRRVRRKRGDKDKVFGCDLLEHLAATNQEVPQVLRCCSEFVESHGIVDGIYRLSGVSSNIQKLRSEFESDGTPDLNKDLYLQDIHCVSSLCKAYFRELPNPLLTYQLYDKFAEAVAIQLEEERLVKIRDVLKELPAPHYRTLEFLMRHLVRVASFASETNMHSRNLAIVWAPNLLRSKEIEVSGFNGTAAFMEVRVQSIVVEFILTHVPQLFPEPGVSTERRKSLPSPSLLTNQDEPFFKPHLSGNIGNLSPGDGPLAMRPYHAIIEGTDKRKGSLKGRKWMSIFNIGGRLNETRRRHKHSTKEKEHPTLRSARSMDSLSPYPNNDSRRSPRPPSTHLSPLAVPPSPQPQPQPDSGPPSVPPLGDSGYAVTYRRGTGPVSGGAGTQGTYTSLDPEGLGLMGTEGVQTRSPGLSAKAGRRIAMHITGPTMVTVPLHITSNLALGVLQRGGADRVVHRGRGKEGGDKGERKGSDKKKEEEEEEEEKLTNRKQVLAGDEETAAGQTEKRQTTGTEEAGRGQCEWEVEAIQNRSKSLTSDTEEPQQEEKDETPGDDYMGISLAKLNDNKLASLPRPAKGTQGTHKDQRDMKDLKGGHYEPATTTDVGEDAAFEAEDVLNSTEVDNLTLSGYVQDNFDFLDQMDCSIVDCSVSHQANEFSVEPPGHYDEDYEVMDQSHSSPIPPPDPTTPVLDLPTPPPDLPSPRLAPLSPNLAPPSSPQTPSKASPPRLRTVDSFKRHTKSMSLPYMTSPVLYVNESSSEEDVPSEDSDDNEYISSEEDDESMFIKSLPADFFLNFTNEGVHGSDVRDQDCKEQLLGFEETQQVFVGSQPIKGAEEEEEVEVEDDKKTEEEEKEESVEESHHLETDISVESTDPDNGGTVEDTHSDAPMDQEDHMLQDTNEINTEEEISHQILPDYQDDELETDGGHVGTVTEEVCHAVEPSGPSELAGEDDVDNVLQEQDDAEEMCENMNEEVDDIWDELENVICEVIEDIETQATETDAVKPAEINEENTEVLCQTKESMDMDLQNVENETAVMQNDELDGKEKLEDRHLDAQCKQEVISEEVPNNDFANAKAKNIDEKPCQIPQNVAKTERLIDESKAIQSVSIQGVGSQIVSSKFPKVYQVKAAPVVPPKPQHCKLTALGIRQQQQQQQQQRERAKEERWSQGTETEELTSRAAERCRDGEDGTRHSPLSMCFDEAVAIATMKRGKSRESDRERHRDWE